jgi:hypothetical protein
MLWRLIGLHTEYRHWQLIIIDQYQLKTTLCQKIFVKLCFNVIFEKIAWS